MSRDLADLARRLVALDTTSTNTNEPLIALLAERLEDAGLRVHVQSWKVDGKAKANLVATIGPAAHGGLLISGHTDTVPFVGQPGWTRDPLVLDIGADRVYGRGTSDMKVFIAQAVCAARSIDRARLRRPLVLAFTADEEVGCLGAARLAPDLERLLGAVPLPTQCWIGEPTGWEVYSAHKSVTLFDVTIRGRGGHSGLPALGVNAIAVAGRVIEELSRYQKELCAEPSRAYVDVFPDAPFSTLNLGTVHGGTVANMIAEECVIRVSTRGLPDIDPLAIRTEVCERLAALDARDPAFPGQPATIEVGEAIVVPAMSSARDSALERALFSRLGRATALGSLLAADGCHFAPLGIATLIAGPGDFDQAHQPNESLSRRAFEEGAHVVRSVVERVCCE
jgi:acetylornithine deacetylase